MDYYPEQLCDLSNADQSLLQLFEIDTGPYKVRQYGYRENMAPIVIRKKSTTVEDRIMEVENLDRRRKLDTAFEYLMTCSDSDYWLDFFKNFIYIFFTFLYALTIFRLLLQSFCSSSFIVFKLIHFILSKYHEWHYAEDTPEKIPFYKLFSMPGIETALWPILYFDRQLCESYLDGSANRISAKKMFISKCFSGVLDYMMNFQLLQYQYDRWLYKTVSGDYF